MGQNATGREGGPRQRGKKTGEPSEGRENRGRIRRRAPLEKRHRRSITTANPILVKMVG